MGIFCDSVDFLGDYANISLTIRGLEEIDKEVEGKRMITAEQRKETITEFKINDKDVGSSHVQVALLTERIKEVTEHLKINKKDHSARRGLMKMVGRRTRLLRYIKGTDVECYRELIKRLGIRR